MPSPDWYHPIDYTDFRTLRSVSLEARWVFMETFCGELGHKTGLALCRPVLIASECGIPVKRVEECLAELERAGIVLWSRDARIAYHVGSLERQGPKPTTKHYKGWAKDLAAFDDCEAKDRAIAELEGNAEPIESLSEGYQNPIDSVSLQEQEQEQEQEPNGNGSLALVAPSLPAKKATRTRKPKAEPKPLVRDNPPTQDQIAAVFVEQGFSSHDALIESRIALNHYSKPEVNWTYRSGSKRVNIVDWQQAIEGWALREIKKRPELMRRQAPPPPDLRGPDGTISQWGPGGDPYANGSKR